MRFGDFSLTHRVLDIAELDLAQISTKENDQIYSDLCKIFIIIR